MSLVAVLLQPSLFSSKLSKAAESARNTALLLNRVSKLKNRREKEGQGGQGTEKALDRGCWADEVRKKLRVCELVSTYEAS